MRSLLKSEMNLRCLAAIAFVALASGCATDISSKSYSDEDVGEAAETYAGVVVKVRTVKVAPDQMGKNHTGMIAGGLAGGLIGSQVASGLGGALITVGLAGAGALGGAALEQKLKTQNGLEITVRLKSGEMRTIVQGTDVAFKSGEHILLMAYARGRSKVVKEGDEPAEKSA
jgi:outer membrane lipoprotein SlyB